MKQIRRGEIATKGLEFLVNSVYNNGVQTDSINGSMESKTVADLKMKWKENAQGKVFVDQSCIACDACVLTAPKNFTMHEEDGHAYVTKQPETPEEEAACKEAQDGCPVEAIGDFGDQEG